nr:porin [uncultured Duganella sp.]
MKKISIAAAMTALFAAQPVLAQSSITVYGVADVGLVGERGGSDGNVTKLTSGPAAASRIGFKGTEDLGGGVAAFFILEAGYSIDTGAFASSSMPFNRQSLIGLKSSAGSLMLGRQTTPYHNTLVAVADPFATGYAGTIKNAFPDWGTNARTNNTVMYASPDVNGWSGDIAYSAGEQAGDSQAGRQLGASFGYSRGPLTVRFAYSNRNNDTAAAAGHRSPAINQLLAANYDFGFVKFYAAIGIDKGFNSAPLGNTGNPFGGVAPTASTDGREGLIGLTMPLARGTLMASLMHKDDRTAYNQDANAWGIGYAYPLSKRTSVYAAYGSIDNRNGAGYTVANNSEAGSGDRAYNLGIRHSF